MSHAHIHSRSCIVALAAHAAVCALVICARQAAAVGDVWTQSSPLPAAVNLESVVSTGSQWVAVGRQGTVLTSSDASTWTPRTTGTTSALHSIAWSGSELLAVGDNGTLITSADSIAWTAAASTLAIRWNAAVWTGTQFVAVGNYGVVATSTTGSTWTLRTPGGAGDWLAAASGAGRIVTVGSQGNISTSTDGLTWTNVTPPTTRWLRSIAHNGSRWVAVGDVGVIFTSADATTWAAATSGTSVRLSEVIWDGAQYIALGDDGIALTSADGLTWTTQPTGTTVAFAGAALFSGTLVAVADHGRIVTSTNVTATWTNVASGSREWSHDAVWTGSQFVAVGSSGVIRTSPDGATWTPETSGTTSSLNGIAWNGTRLVAIGSAGTIVASTNGTTWTTQATGTTRPLFGVTWTGSQFIAVGLRGTIFTSSDGLGWVSVSSGTTATLRAVAAAGSQIIAVGDGGAILTLSGSTWTVRASGVSDDLTSVATNGSRAVIGGETGRMLTSTNLATWTSQSAPFSSSQGSGVHGLRWTGSEFIAVGHQGSFMNPNGSLMNSLDGVTWVVRQSNVSTTLDSVVAGTSAAVAVGDGGLTLVNIFTTMPVADVSPVSASISEESGVQIVTVTLSAAATNTVIVPAQLSGTAVIGTDATISTLPITIVAGQTTGSATVTGIPDKIDEPDRTVIITISAPLGARLGVSAVSTITILDDDTPPIFGTPPVGDIVMVGTSVTFSTAVTGGEPLTQQWLRNEVAISGATQTTYTLPAATVAQAGAYRLRAKNPSGTVSSGIAELGVVDGTSKALSYIAGATATLTVSAGGNGLTFQWQRNNTNVANDTRISGATTNKLVIKTISGKDAGTYRCLVTNASGSVLGGTNTVSVTSKPFLLAPNFPVIVVSQFVVLPVWAGNSPTKFTITGLPSGLTYSSTTGIISGRALIHSGSLPFQIKITASNAAGSGPTLTAPLTVQALPDGTSGSFLGTVQRMNGLNATSALGGRLSLSVSSNGKLTGSTTIGGSTHSFASTLETSPSTVPGATILIARGSLPSLQIDLTATPASQFFSGTISDGNASTTFTAQRSMVAPFTGYPGYYTSALQLANNGDVGQEAIPQGAGYAFFTIGSTGTASGTVRLADGTQFALSTPLRSNGALVIYAPLYGTRGSLLGTLTVTPGAPALVSTGGLDWFKQPITPKTRSYDAGFAATPLSATGARYTAPSGTGIAMGLTPSADNVPNAALEFSQGGAPSPATRLDVQLRYSAIAMRDPQTPASNPGKVTITVTPSSGLLSGSFSLTDTDMTTSNPLIRTTSWNGLIARDIDGVLRGFGHFQLAKTPDNSMMPFTTRDTSPKLSGKVSLRPLP
jgi:hypothetical protein